MKLETVNLERSADLSEQWVQDQIAADPTILGLGDLVLRDRERRQITNGRLDLLLQDPETLKRFEVEIQLGATDESHIIRTIEYWDIERKRYPQYEHAAVIVAEDITSRFLNVIQLFNGHIPIIALKLTVYRVGNEYALTFVKVLDEMTFGLVDDDEPVTEPTDRSYWESNRGSKETLQIADELLVLVREIEPTATLKYNKYYVGLDVDGSAKNFLRFIPRKGHLIVGIRLAKSQEFDDLIDNAEIETLTYVPRWREYRLRVDKNLGDKELGALRMLMQKAQEAYGKSG